MSDEPKAIEVYASRRFSKALGKLSVKQLKTVEDEVDKIIADPEIGELKKGDLAHLRVHKFSMNNQQALLGYSWLKDEIQIYLLQLGTHENFYQKMKHQRKNDLKLQESGDAAG